MRLSNHIKAGDCKYDVAYCIYAFMFPPACVHPISLADIAMDFLVYSYFHFFLYFCPVVSTQRGTRPVSAPVFSQAALAEAGIPMAPFDQPQTSTPIKTTRKEDRKLEVTVEAVEPSKIHSVADVKVVVTAFHVLC